MYSKSNDALRSILRIRQCSELEQATFGYLTRAQSVVCQMRADAANVHDVLVLRSGFEEQREEGAGHEVRASEIHVEHLPPVFGIRVCDEAVLAQHPSVVDKHV